MSRYLPIWFLLFAPIPSFAQPAPPDQLKSAMPAQSTRYINNCERFYPAAAAAAGIQGNSVVAVHLSSDGTATNPTLVQSSGDNDLDRAAISCLDGMHMAPVTHNGAPLELDMDMEVEWRLSFFHSATPFGPANVCNYAYYPPVAVRMSHQGDAQLSYVVSGDGLVKNVTITQTSGYPELDKASVDCVSRFRYRPATQNGKPVEYDKQTVIKWRLH